MKYSACPDLTKNYPAIDGIAKPERNHHRSDNNCMAEDRVYFDSAEEAIRSDVLPILDLSDAEFEHWYRERFDALTKVLKEWELIGSIPNLGWTDQPMTFGQSVTQFRYQIEGLNEALNHLVALKDRRLAK
jgi:hypothetical protein